MKLEDLIESKQHSNIEDLYTSLADSEPTFRKKHWREFKRLESLTNRTDEEQEKYELYITQFKEFGIDSEEGPNVMFPKDRAGTWADPVTSLDVDQASIATGDKTEPLAAAGQQRADIVKYSRSAEEAANGLRPGSSDWQRAINSYVAQNVPSRIRKTVRDYVLKMNM